MSRICSDLPHHVLGGWTLRPNDVGFFSPRFSSPIRNEAGLFRNQQSRTWSFGVNHGSIRDSWPIAFSGYPRGLGSDVRLGARDTQRLTNQLRLSLEPECLENPRPPPEKIPGMGRKCSETLKLFVVSDVGRRSTLLSSTRSTRWWQSSWPRSAAPFPAACPWPTIPHRTLRRDRAWSRRRSPLP